MTASECATESALLKQCWLLTEAGYDRKQIKFSNNRIYVSGKIFGQVTNGEFHCSENDQIHPPQPLQCKGTTSPQLTSINVIHPDHELGVIWTTEIIHILGERIPA